MATACPSMLLKLVSALVRPLLANAIGHNVVLLDTMFQETTNVASDPSRGDLCHWQTSCIQHPCLWPFHFYIAFVTSCSMYNLLS